VHDHKHEVEEPKDVSVLAVVNRVEHRGELAVADRDRSATNRCLSLERESEPSDSESDVGKNLDEDTEQVDFFRLSGLGVRLRVDDANEATVREGRGLEKLR